MELKELLQGFAYNSILLNEFNRIQNIYYDIDKNGNFLTEEEVKQNIDFVVSKAKAMGIPLLQITPNMTDKDYVNFYILKEKILEKLREESKDMFYEIIETAKAEPPVAESPLAKVLMEMKQ